MIPIKEAISSGAWLHCEFTDSKVLFRIKVLSFRKLNLSEFDEPDKIDFKDEGIVIWIMDLEVINLTKEGINSFVGPGNLILTDQDGFEFNCFFDSHLCWNSQFAKRSKTNRFYAENLLPKIKAIGAIPFQLPDDDEAVYSISVKDGSIREA